MYSAFCRPYVFEDQRGELHVIVRGEPGPDRGIEAHWFRLHAVVFDDRNIRERERLLLELALPDLRPGTLDLADRFRVEDQLYRELERRFTLYEVPRRPAVRPLKPVEWFPATKSSRPELSWIGLWLVDQTSQAIGGRPYRLVTPDAETMAGTLDDQGSANLKRVAPGNCQVFCPDVQPHPSSTYVVQQGDHLSGIAQAFGFDDYMLVWSRPENAALRALRTNAHELVEGDQVFIPPLAATPVMKPAGADHVFILRRSPLRLRVKLLGMAMKPLAPTPCRLNATTLTPDGDGVIAVDLDKSTQSAPLAFADEEYQLLPGALTPHDQTQDDGWLARLYNLGFLFDLNINAEDGAAELRLALEDFQAEAGLTVTGEIDDATRTALLQQHGDTP